MISKKTLHAIELCVFLAGQRHAGPVTTAEMSPRLGLSVSYLESLLKPLRSSGIVGAIKGPGGGYLLDEAPEKTSIWTVLLAFEHTFDAPLAEPWSLDEQVEDATPMADFEIELERLVKDTLSQRTLADFAQAAPSQTAPSLANTLGRFKFKPMAAPLMPKAPNSVFQLSMQMA